MKKLIHMSTIILVQLIFTQFIFSQMVNTDSVKIGRLYKFILVNDFSIEGELLNIDSLRLTVKTLENNIKIPIEQLIAVIVPSEEFVSEYFEKSYVENPRYNKNFNNTRKMDASVSIDGGLGFFTTDEFSNNSSSYAFDITGTYYFSRSAGIRGKLNMNFFKHSNNHNYYYEPGYYDEGGDLSIHIFTIEALLGSFKPESNTVYYAILGGGLVAYSESDRESHTPYYTNIFRGETTMKPGIKVGFGFAAKASKKLTLGGELQYGFMPELIELGLLSLNPKLSYKLTGRVSIFGEPQYTFPLVMDAFGGFYPERGYFTVKTGIELSL